MVMEFVRGETVHELSERMGALAPPQAAHLAMQVLDALSHAHRAGVVHRDLKPANLMITEMGVVKVMDFGIARVLGTEHFTQGGYMMGTPAYMAPEQVLGGEIDGRADLYAVGVVLYRLLSGQLPFSADTAIAMVQKQVNDSPTPIAQFQPDLPGWCAKVLARALAKAPADRYQTADEFRTGAAVSGAATDAGRAADHGDADASWADDRQRADAGPCGDDGGKVGVRQDPAPGRGHIGWCDCGCCRRRARHGDNPCTDADRNQGARSHDHDRRLGRNHLFAIGGVFFVLIAGVAILSLPQRCDATSCRHSSSSACSDRTRRQPAAAGAGRGDAANACAGRIRAAVGTFVCAGNIAVSGRTASRATRRNATAGSFGSKRRTHRPALPRRMPRVRNR